MISPHNKQLFLSASVSTYFYVFFGPAGPAGRGQPPLLSEMHPPTQKTDTKDLDGRGEKS